MTSFEIFFLLLIFVGLYVAEHFVFFLGVLRGTQPGGINNSENLPFVTVLVCARDEEANIARCMDSLVNLAYPVEKIELLFVDDKSSDRTPEIMAGYASRYPQIRIFRTGPEVEHLRGKVNALTQGMDEAKGEIVMVTDADSTITPDWVRAYVSYYDKDTGIVASVTLLEENNAFATLQSLEWSYLLGIAMSCSNLKIPLSVIGNNMSVRREAYESVGGYRKIPFSITEDYALFQAIWHKKPWKVKFHLTPSLLVTSQACDDFISWWRQKHRWVKGGEGLKALGYAIFILGLMGNLGMVAAIFLLPLPSMLFIVLLKWSADLMVIIPTLRAARRMHLVRWLPLYELYLPIFVLLMPVMILQKNVKWKGRVYKH